MPLRQATLDRQLEQANARLAKHIEKMDKSGIAKGDRSKDAKWRSLNADCVQIRARMKAVSVVVARDAEAANRKAEKLAAPKVAEPKAKKAKTEKAPKEKAKKEKKPKEAAAAKE
jgi:hypothetical protein